MWSGTLLHLPYKSTQVHPSSSHLGCTTSVQSAHQAVEDMLPGTLSSTLSSITSWTFNFNQPGQKKMKEKKSTISIAKFGISLEVTGKFSVFQWFFSKQFCFQISIFSVSKLLRIQKRKSAFAFPVLTTRLGFAMEAPLQHKLHNGSSYVGSPNGTTRCWCSRCDMEKGHTFHTFHTLDMERKAKNRPKIGERMWKDARGTTKTAKERNENKKKTSMDSNSSNRHQQTVRKRLHYGSQSALFGPPSLGHLASSPGQNRHRDRHLHLSHLFETQCLCVSNVTSFSCVHWKPTARATQERQCTGSKIE